MNQTSTGIQGAVEYSTDLYKEETIERMISHYINLLGSIISSANEQIGRLNILSAVEEQKLLVDFNDRIGIKFLTLAFEIEDLFNKKVDVVSRNGIKPKYFKYVEEDLIYV